MTDWTEELFTFDDLPPHFREFEGNQEFDYIHQLGAHLAGRTDWSVKSSIPATVQVRGTRISIGINCTIEPFVVIEEPAVIGDGVTIKSFSYLDGGSFVGARCMIADGAHIKGSVVMPGTYIGRRTAVCHSWIGSRVELAAGVILMNQKLNRRESFNDFEQRRCGSLVGDAVRIGAGALVYPAAIIGRHSIVYPGAHVRGRVPSHSILKVIQNQLTVRQSTRVDE